MVEFSFLYPQFLLLLLLIPFFIFVYFFSLVYNKKRALVFGNFKAIERFYAMEFFSKNFLALYLNILILALIVFSIAGTWVSFSVGTSAYAHVLLIDTSESMSATDLPPDRISVAKLGAKRFVDLLPLGSEIGVISFSGDAKVLHALDTLKPKIKTSIDGVTFGEIHGTNVYNALLTANKLFEDRTLKSVILISDGQSNVQDAPQIIRYIERNGITVHTLAVGTSQGGLTGQNVISKLDEDFLRSISFNSKGEFYLVTDQNTMRQSIDKIAQLTNRQARFDLSFYFLIAALVLFTINWILHNLRFKVVP